MLTMDLKSLVEMTQTMPQKTDQMLAHLGRIEDLLVQTVQLLEALSRSDSK